jgi:7-keto-8-aminopelargonate synthetase-like enzyme
MTLPRPNPLAGSVGDFHKSRERNLLDRWLPHEDWWSARLEAGVDPYCKAIIGPPGPVASCAFRDGSVFRGVNFASQDYLSLSTHPSVIAAAGEAAALYGVHSAGSAALMGNTEVSWRLEKAIADFLGMTDCTLFSTGWGAGYGVIRTLVSRDDHVVIDVLAHACLYEGAHAATDKVHRSVHLSVDGLEHRLRRIRAKEPDAGILVVTEGLFSMDSDTPDIAATQALCVRYDATLMLDVAHDLGVLGESGRGVLEMQNALGSVDLVMGSFSKTFGTNGGFVATRHRALKQALRSSGPTQTFTNAIGPVGASIAEACLSIVRGPEGDRRRQALAGNVAYLRAALEQAGFELLGQPSPIVPVILGDVALAREMTGHAIRNGALVNLVEYPAVSRNSSRWRLQVMADHTPSHIDQLVEVAVNGRSVSGSRAA